MGGAKAALRILFIEDEDDTREVVSMLLEHHGHRVDAYPTVAEAIAALGERSYDVLLCDLALQDGVGHEVVRSLRTSGSRLPAIALTGHVAHRDVEEALAAGFTAHLRKPVDSGELLQAIEWLCIK